MNETVLSALSLYEAALKPPRSRLLSGLKSAWTAGGLAVLAQLAWRPPFGPWASSPVAMALRAVLLVETIGYIYHRFFQHVGFFTRRSGLMRRNQKYHWIHHMIIYPIGRLYRRAMEYVPAEPGIAWSWIVPGVLAGALFMAQNGVTVSSAVFLGAIALYAKGLIDVTHTRFHEIEHPWIDKPYFHWLEEIHLLHHWDQRYNFTIVHPAMDVLFGTYLSPATHRRELKTAMDAEELTASDLINWRYLLVEATPAEYAAFISEAKRHRPSLEKLARLIDVLRVRVAHAEDDSARDMLQKALDLQRVLVPEPALR
jgi:hypothetical protein